MNGGGDISGAARGPADPATLALVDALKTLVCDGLARGIAQMFDGADDMLFEMARRATNNKDQRVYFDAMRVVRLGRPRIGQIFRDEIVIGFDIATQRAQAERATKIAYENLSLQEAKSLEESIAVSAMASKAENLYGDLLFELGRRLQWLIQEKHAPISSNALTPATISDAFRRAAVALDVEFDVGLVIFKLFDRLVINELGDLYRRVLAFMDERQVKAAAIGGAPLRKTEPPTATGPAGPARTAPATAASYGFAQLPMIDAATLHALRNRVAVPGIGVPSSMSAGGYGDAQLGNEIAMAASGQVVPGWEAPRAYAYAQRAGVVGQMFNELMQDPTLPSPLKPRFDQLRFAVIKSALKDAGFFADHLHPVRSLLNELATLAASARASGNDAMHRIEELVAQIQAQFEVAAEEVRSQVTLPGAVDAPVIEQFLARQKEEARQRRQAIIARTRRVVAEELQLRTLGRKVADGTWPLLNAGWAPLASLCLLKQGAASADWKSALQLLHRVLDSVDARRPDARTDERLRQLESELDARLREIGMSDERVFALLRAWRESAHAVASEPAVIADGSDELLDEIRFETEPAGPATESAELTGAHGDARTAVPDSAPRMAAPDPVALLDLLMVLSSWFRVYDHDRGQNRWLKVVGHYPDDGNVAFAEFNGQNKLKLATQVFLDDLVAGRAEPIDLGPAARRSLDAYLAARRGTAQADATQAA